MTSQVDESATAAAVTAAATERRQIRPQSNSTNIRFRDDWELTWPIWHMLPRSERKELAQQHGYETIGAFEEFMTLQRAVGETTDLSEPYDATNLLYGRAASDNEQTETSTEAVEPGGGIGASTRDANETAKDEETAVLAEEQLNRKLVNEQYDQQERTSEMLEHGGAILVLPDEILHRIFAYLPVDAYATLALVSPHWKSFTRTELVYKRLCERLYLNQSKRKALHVGRFQNSYRLMLEMRPRVRAGGGECSACCHFLPMSGCMICAWRNVTLRVD